MEFWFSFRFTKKHNQNEAYNPNISPLAPLLGWDTQGVNPKDGQCQGHFESVFHHENLLKIETEDYYGPYVNIYKYQPVRSHFKSKSVSLCFGHLKIQWIERCLKYSDTFMTWNALLTSDVDIKLNMGHNKHLFQ